MLANISEISLIPVECISERMSFWDELVLATLLPLGAIAMAWLIAKLVLPEHSARKKATTFTLLLAFIVLPMTSAKIFRTFICLSFEDDQSYLAADLAIRCTGTRYTMMKAFSACAIAVYPVGIPLSFLMILRANREAIFNRDISRPCPPELKHIAFLFDAYSNESMFWEVIECVRRMLLSSLIVFMGETSATRTTWGVLLALFFAILCGEVQPCMDPNTQAFSFLANWHVFVHFLLALILATGVGLFSPSAIGTLFVILTLMVIVGAFGHREKHKQQDQTLKLRLGVRQPAKIKAQPCVLICDVGRTADTELALVLLRVLRDLGHIEPKAVIATLWPQQDRSRLLRRRLDSLGLHDVPVGIGTDGGVSKHDREISETLCTLGETPAFSGSPERAGQSVPGGRLLETTCDNADPASLVILVMSSLKDAAICLRDSEERFKAKVKSVVLMGGISVSDTGGYAQFKGRHKRYRRSSLQNMLVPEKIKAEPPMAPDNCEINQFDIAAAQFFMSRCQHLGIQLIMVPIEATRSVTVPSAFYDQLADGGSASGHRIRQVTAAWRQHAPLALE